MMLGNIKLSTSSPREVDAIKARSARKWAEVRWIWEDVDRGPSMRIKGQPGHTVLHCPGRPLSEPTASTKGVSSQWCEYLKGIRPESKPASSIRMSLSVKHTAKAASMKRCGRGLLAIASMYSESARKSRRDGHHLPVS
jgi:hypothetical protein